MSVVDAAFDDAQPSRFEALARRLGDPELRMLLIRVEGRPACAGRLDLPTNRSFAALYGGCTHPSFRRRGLFRAVVSARSALARQRGHGFLTVDARPTSAPILARLGFQPLTPATSWVLRPR